MGAEKGARKRAPRERGKRGAGVGERRVISREKGVELVRTVRGLRLLGLCAACRVFTIAAPLGDGGAGAGQVSMVAQGRLAQRRIGRHSAG